MQKNFENFSMQEALRLAKSPAGQQLIALLQQTESEKIQQAKDQADAGDYDSVKTTLASVLENEEVKALMKQLGG